MLIIQQKRNLLESSRTVTKQPIITDIFSMGFSWKKNCMELIICYYFAESIGTIHFGPKKYFPFILPKFKRLDLKFCTKNIQTLTHVYTYIRSSRHDN